MLGIGLFNADAYSESIRLFLHLLGAIYFFSFGALFFQIKGLLGQKGILPVQNYLRFLKFRLQNKRFYHIPTIFWLGADDAILQGVCAFGAMLGLILLFGVSPPLILPILIILHLSILSVGQDFLSFGWEGFLLEISYNAFFISLTEKPNVFLWISLNLLIFRFHFEAGTSKLESRDPNWRNLTAIKFHYQSQPLPNTLAWYVYKLPMTFHKFSAFFMFFSELVIPFFALFGTEEMRLASFILLFGLQFMIWVTGNFSYLNHVTSVLLILLISNSYLEVLFGPAPSLPESSYLLNAFLSLVGICFIALQLMAFWNHYLPTLTTRRWLSKIYHLHVANRYGIFAIMTTTRYEIVLEGSYDQIEWKEYYFVAKPSEISRRPRRISPYQPRLDWQAWFLPFAPFEEQDWLKNLFYCLLVNSPHVVELFRHNSFKEKPPKFVQAKIYIYEFTSFEEKRKTGNWWKRELIGNYSPIYELKT